MPSNTVPVRLLASWPTCRVCSHPVSPRSEVCHTDHPRCTMYGCSVAPLRVALNRASAPIAAAGPTSFLIDIASYQTGLDLHVVRAAGYSHVNIKLSQGNWYTYSGGPAFAKTARALGMDVIGFHWLDNSASGTEQARYCWAQAGKVGVDGIQIDCEDAARPATWQILADFANWIQDAMGRHAVIYTGDWWWKPRGFNGASLTPYLWAAPNNGYLPAYPGDTSSAWSAGYGGWPTYSLLQYAVSGLTGAGGGNLSKTAIRDPAVWAALTGGAGMELTTTVTGTATAAVGGDRNVHDVLMDLANGRAVQVGEIAVDKYYRPGTPMRQVYEAAAAVPGLAKDVGELKRAVAALGSPTLSPADIDAIADKVAAAIVADMRRILSQGEA